MSDSNQFTIAFTGLVTGVALWSIYGGDIFPKEADPTGDPDTWSKEEMRRWLAAVCSFCERRCILWKI